jgi:hypothetical protein
MASRAVPGGAVLCSAVAGSQGDQESQAVVVSPIAANIVDGVDFDEWLAIGQRFLGLHRSSAWWLGDWLVYGEWCYGSKYRVAVEHLSLTYDRLRDYAYVAANVRPPVRRRDLSFSHHRLVAKLAPDDQRAWLARAAAERWSKRTLADALQADALQAHAPGSSAQASASARLRLSIDEDRLSRWKMAALSEHTALHGWVIATLDRAATT